MPVYGVQISYCHFCVQNTRNVYKKAALLTYPCFILASWHTTPHFHQTRSAWSMDQGSNENHSPVNNFVPTVTKFCVLWEGQALPHDTKFGNCRDKIVDSRAFLSWSLIHGSNWSGLIKLGPFQWHGQYHDDIVKWKHFPSYRPFVRGIHWSLVNSPHKDQWCGALTFSLICAWMNSWVNYHEAGDLRCQRTHYDITVMITMKDVTNTF